jgi:hypothetical protein
MGVTFAGMKHDLSSVKTSDSSLGTSAHSTGTPPLKQQHGNHQLIAQQHQHANIWPNYYPIPTAAGAAVNSTNCNASRLVPPPSFTASTTASSGGTAATPMKNNNGRVAAGGKFTPFGGGSRMYHQHQVGQHHQQAGSLSEEAYEELDFIRRSPGVGEEGMVRHLSS